MVLDGKRVLVCGGRHYVNHKYLFHILDGIDPELVITGTYQDPSTQLMDIKGADNLAHTWCRMKGVQSVICEANFVYHGKPGGPIRNGRMLLLYPTLVLAFPGGTGTANMIKRSKACDVKVLEMTE